jgi:hypothetical protein
VVKLFYYSHIRTRVVKYPGEMIDKVTRNLLSSRFNVTMLDDSGHLFLPLMEKGLARAHTKIPLARSVGT